MKKSNSSTHKAMLEAKNQEENTVYQPRNSFIDYLKNESSKDEHDPSTTQAFNLYGRVINNVR